MPGVERLRATVKAMVIDPGAVVDVHAPVLDPPRSLPWTQYRDALTRSTARQESVAVAPAVPDRQAWLGVLINRVTAFALVANALVIAGNPKVLTPWIPHQVMVLVLIALGAACVPILVLAVRGQSGLTAGWVFIGATLVTNLAMAGAPKIGLSPVGTPLAATSTVIAAGLAAVAFRSAATSTITLGAVCLSYAAVRAPATGWVFGLLDAGITFLGCSILGLLVRSLRETYAAVAIAEEDRAAVVARTAALLDRRRVREEWDRLLHDQVLGALLVASRATSLSALSTARALAGDALRSLGVVESPTRHRSLAELADRRGLTLRGDGSLPRTVPGDVRDAVTAAFDEVLANVSRHAGVHDVTVSVTGGRHALSVIVRDHGVGFDPRHRSDRFGLARSIPGHVASIGGTCTVDSAPDAGTTVTLAWASEDLADARLSAVSPVTWRWGGRRGRLLFTGGWVTLHLITGYLAVSESWSLAHWGLAIGLAVSVVAGVSAEGRMAWVWLAVTAAAVVSLGVTTEPTALDWRYWFVGIALPLPVILVMDRRLRRAWITCVVLSGALLVGMMGHGWSGVWTVREAFASPWIITAIAAMGVYSLDRALRDLRESTDALVAQRRTAERLTHRAELDRQRRRQLSRDVIPVLRNIWSASIVTEASRQEAVLVEAGARDRLTGAVLLDTAVADAARAARARGARVILLADREAGPHPALAAFRNALACLLATCGDGSRLTATWHPDHEESWGTLAVTGPVAPIDPTCLRLQGQRVVIDQDPDETWIEFVGAAATSHPLLTSS